jgi:hypothetical protein
MAAHHHLFVALVAPHDVRQRARRQSDSRGGAGSLAFSPLYARGSSSVIMPGRDIFTARTARNTATTTRAN